MGLFSTAVLPTQPFQGRGGSSLTAQGSTAEIDTWTLHVDIKINTSTIEFNSALINNSP